MSLPRRYNPKTAEPEIQALWREEQIYHFDRDADAPVYSIDTPPPTVSGHLHLGHVYSYSHTDFMARFWRMRGYNVFYPMGFDDNGLPTERLVEEWEGITALEVGREAFIERCLAVSERAEEEYEALWRRLGLSIDWRYSYRTIDARSRRISQLSFIDLYRKGLAYRKEAPTIWCPECGTAIAQAELNDLERESVFYTLAFQREEGEPLEIATTRPELLPACVAVFVHPDDERYADLVGEEVRVPYFGHRVPVLTDPAAEPDPRLEDEDAERFGEVLVEIATAVRRYKSEQSLSLGTKIPALYLAPADPAASVERLRAAKGDLASITRAQEIEVVERLPEGAEEVVSGGAVAVGLVR